MAAPISIASISPLPSQAISGKVYYGTYKLTALPNQTIVFKNNFPIGVTQITEGNVCKLKNKMDSSGMCVINLKLIAPQTAAYLNPIIKTYIDGTPICVQYPIPIQVVVKNLASIVVSPTTVTLATGETQNFTAIGTYTDSTTQDITSSVNWNSSDLLVANIDAQTGIATALSAGSTNITALMSGITSNESLLTVTTKPLASIVVSPTTVTLATGETQNFTAIGTYADNTTQDITSSVNWNSSDLLVANIDTQTGIATALSAGSANIIASKVGIVSNSSSLVVTAPRTLVSITVTPTNSTKAIGESQNFIAIGTYDDGSTQDITARAMWISDNPTIAIASNGGLVTAISCGTANITASFDSISSLPSRIIVRTINIYSGTYAGNVWKYSNTTWDKLGGTAPGGSILALTMDSDNNIYIGTNNGNIWLYDGTDWIALGKNLDSGGIHALALDGNNNLYVGTGGANVWKYSNNNWTKIGFNLDGGAIYSLKLDSSNNIYIGTYAGNVWRYNGATWIKIASNLDGTGIYALTLDNNNNLYVGTSGRAIWKYDNNSWIKMGSCLDGGIIRDLVSDSNNNIYIGTGGGNVWQYNGSVWNKLGGKSIDGSEIYTVTVDINNSVYSGTGNNDIWKYSNSGWNKIGTNLDNQPVMVVVARSL